MAIGTFLNPSEKAMAIEKLTWPTTDGSKKNILGQALEFSRWLSLVIERRLAGIPHWEEASPIALGSWGRGELCPASDLDMIFCGQSQAILKVVREVEKLGLKFRYRQPRDMEDWTENVKVMEANALFSARTFTEQGFEKLELQKNRILKKRKTFRSRLLKAMEEERNARLKRYDSIVNFLEPNIKFGAGGLRDIHQTLILFHWFPERFEAETHTLKVLMDHKALLLLIRQRLHLTNSFDILTAGDQRDMTGWLGHKSSDDFTKKIQETLSRVNFYSDWANERCGFSQRQWEGLKVRQIRSWTGVFDLLCKNPSLQNQALIQKTLHRTRGFQEEEISGKKTGRFLKKILDISQDKSVTSAAFRSRTISCLIPDFKKVMGLVQHDQYHRFSVDVHLLKTIEETQCIYREPGKLGSLQFLSKKLKLSDWNILRWSALYHDLAKGRGGDHHKKGEKLARRDLTAFGFSRGFVDEVCWLVENHLVLSHGAFRESPHSVETWQELFSKGVLGDRLYRLAIFTVIDIRATNPEAWSVWKEKLLRQLVEYLINPGRQQSFSFIRKVKEKKIKIQEGFLYRLEPLLAGGLPHSLLLKDLRNILEKKERDPMVIRDRYNQVWVRFHSQRDNRGLLYSFTGKLTGLGCNIRQAFIHTHKSLGVYDWFQVKTRKKLSILKKQLLHDITLTDRFLVSFSKIELVKASEKEWVFGFRAKDQRGLLLAAIKALYKEELEIVWARVHTWGNQIDDVFGVLPKEKKEPEQILENFKKEPGYSQ